jgi:hypothetical protein
LTPHAPLQHQRIEQFPMEPRLGQGAVGFRPQRVDIAHTLPAFYGDFDVIVTTHKTIDLVFHRLALDRLRDAAWRGAFDAVVILAPDRLARH